MVASTALVADSEVAREVVRPSDVTLGVAPDVAVSAISVVESDETWAEVAAARVVFSDGCTLETSAVVSTGTVVLAAVLSEAVVASFVVACAAEVGDVVVSDWLVNSAEVTAAGVSVTELLVAVSETA